MELKQIGNSFAARIVGLSLESGVSPEALSFIRQALIQYPVLCLPDQPVDDNQQAEFISSFGPRFEPPASAVSRAGEYFSEVSNVEADGRPIEKGSAKAKFVDANLYWHADGSYMQPPIRLTCLSARVLPDHPPATEFADMRAAFDALPDAMKARCLKLEVKHSLYFSRRMTGMDIAEFTPEMRQAFGVVAHPLVRMNPHSGRRSLYLGAHAGRVVGWSDDESADFLAELTAFATRPRFVHAHDWSPCDFLLWDDSCTIHRATPFDRPEPRQLRWTAVLEEGPTVPPALSLQPIVPAEFR